MFWKRTATPGQRAVFWKGLVISPAPWSNFTSVVLLPPGYEYHQVGPLRWLIAPDGEQYVLADGTAHWVVVEHRRNR